MGPESTALSPTAIVRRRKLLPVLGVIDPSSSLARTAWSARKRHCGGDQSDNDWGGLRGLIYSGFTTHGRGVFCASVSRRNRVFFLACSCCGSTKHKLHNGQDFHERSYPHRCIAALSSQAKGKTPRCTQLLHILAAPQLVSLYKSPTGLHSSATLRAACSRSFISWLAPRRHREQA